MQGFVRDLLDLMDVRQADYLICAFDEGEITFRHEIYDRYKIDRPPMPGDLQLQMPVIRRFVERWEFCRSRLPAMRPTTFSRPSPDRSTWPADGACW